MPREIKITHPLWDYFSRVTTEPKMAICNQCSKKLSHKTTITNLKSHLKRLHNAHYNSYIRKLKKHDTLVQDTDNPTVSTNQTVYLLPISSTSEQQIKYEIPSPENQETEDSDDEGMTDTGTKIRGTLLPEEKKQMDARLLMFIVESYQPVTIVERGFKNLVKTMNADYTILERKDITKRILPEMYSKSLEEHKTIVQQNAVTICLTVDRWTSAIYEDSLIAITAHFITPGYQFKSVLLKCHYCERNSEDLETVLTEICTEWEIAGKINWCVTDDGADIAQAAKSLGWNHRVCMAYKLNLVLQNSLKLCDATLTKVKTIVGYFESNFESEQMLGVYQNKQGIAEPLELLDSEHTSWTSKYDMIERFVTLKEAIEAIITELDDEVDLPDITDEDWNKLKQLCKLMKPFKEATKELGVDKYSSASKVIAVVNGLKDVLQELRKRPDCYHSVKEVVECIENELNEQFDGIESEPNLALCTILDPRYKMSMFLDESAGEMAKLNLVSEIEGLMKDGTNPPDRLKMNGGPSTANNEDGGDFSLWRRRTLEKSLANQSVNQHRLAQQEVESYMQEELADGDPGEWWQSNESKFPHLAKLFQTRCNKVATSVPSDYLFTEHGIDLCERRNRLSLRKAEMIVFLHANLNDDDYFRLMPESYDGARTLSV